MIKHLVCQDCGNDKKFGVGVTEYHRYEVDGAGMFIDDLGGDDVKYSDDWQCMECDSFNVKWVELDLKSIPTTS